MSSVVSSPDSGNPPPNAFPIVTTSGRTPVWSVPQRFPVRPRPVIISSVIRRGPILSAPPPPGGGALPGPALHGLHDRGRAPPRPRRFHLLAADLGAGDAAARVLEADRAP